MKTTIKNLRENELVWGDQKLQAGEIGEVDLPEELLNQLEKRGRIKIVKDKPEKKKKGKKILPIGEIKVV